MIETGNGLLVARIVRLEVASQAFLRVELANACPGHDSAGPTGSHDEPVAVLRADELAQVARRFAAGGILFAAKESALGRSRLPGLLRRLRSEYAGWIGLEMTGPEPGDLRAVVRDGLVDFLDVQLAWLEQDADTGAATFQVAPSLRRVVPILLKVGCPCVVRFQQPAEADLSGDVCAAFDEFVRMSPDPVAVQVVESSERASIPEACQAAEFIACRPAWLVRQSQGQWY
jgi:hypothetical protein